MPDVQSPIEEQALHQAKLKAQGAAGVSDGRRST
jgi:hypothetical protein